MSSDDGSATIEYIGVALAMLVPIAYFVVAFTQVQSATYGVVGAAQQGARAYVQSSSDYLGRFAAARAAAIAGRNHGLIITSDQVRITCAVANCLQPGTVVTIDVRTSIPVPYAPQLGRIPLHSQQVIAVDAYRADPS